MTLEDSRNCYLFASREGRYVVGVERGKARLWDGKTGKLLRRFGDSEPGQGHLNIGGGTPTATFDRDYTMAVIGSPNGLAVLPFDPKRQPFSIASSGVAIFGVAISPDGKRIAAGVHDQPLRIFQIEGEELRLLRKYGAKTHSGGDVSFSGDGRFVSTAAGKMIRIWNVESGEMVHRFDDARGGQPSSVFFVPGTDWVLSARYAGPVYLRPVPKR